MNEQELNRLNKAYEILNIVTKTATAVAQSINGIPRPYKSMRICKAHRRRQAIARAKLCMLPALGAAQIAMVASRRCPRFKSGGIVANEMS